MPYLLDMDYRHGWIMALEKIETARGIGPHPDAALRTRRIIRT
jgi:hypothetical protein